MKKDVINRSVANAGNPARLVRLMKRAQEGEALTLGFFGGSITQGCLSSVPETCYAYLVYKWFCDRFPKARFTYVNGGIGGTTSQFGIARADENMLSYEPDFIVVEFSVNDDANEFFKESYEALIRRFYNYRTNPALLIMNNLFYEDGHNAQVQHNEIGAYYGIPCVSIRDALYPEIEAGQMLREELTTDNLHPNDYGHSCLAELATAYLSDVYEKYIVGNNQPGEDSVPAEPLTVNAYAEAVRIQNYNYEPALNGFVKDTQEQENLRDIFKRGWYAWEKGAWVTFETEASEIAVQYRKTITQPAPVAVAIIDGDTSHPFVLDANFEETWGDSLHIDTLMYHGKLLGAEDKTESGLAAIAGQSPVKKKHTVTITITDTHEDEKTPFYLVSLITA